MEQVALLREQLLSQSPTDEQKDAIFTNELEFLLRASPGSGKTWTSCRRFIWRGANWKYRVGGLALLSFTNAAIREFQEATIDVGRKELLSEPNYVGTFDSFVERFIITPFGHLAAGLNARPRLFIAPRPGDRNNKKLQTWVAVRGGRMRPVPAWEIIPYPHNNTVAYRTTNKFDEKTLEFNSNNPVNEFFKLGFYTHAQRVFLACRILSDRPHIAKCISRRFPEIIVDEAQDTNVWLLILLGFLRNQGTKITLIGDPDQCIYEFSLADALSLPTLKKEWNISEKPLSKSFRCNNRIAESVRNISGNLEFVGCGASTNNYHRPFVFRVPNDGISNCISKFEQLLVQGGVSQSDSAILCRAHKQIESIRGIVNYAKLEGLTKEMAQAAFHRDLRKDYIRAQRIVEKTVREMTDQDDLWEQLDEFPESEASHKVRLSLWRFTKSTKRLPSVLENGTDWISKLKTSLIVLFSELGVSVIPKMGYKIKKKGLTPDQLTLPLFEPQSLFPSIRQETIQQVKGQSIDGVLVYGSTQFFNLLVKAVKSNENTADRRLAYVAMTRARHILLVGLPASHYDNHLSSWKEWGFSDL
jgi:superfamily I DNA/RNA helicase